MKVWVRLPIVIAVVVISTVMISESTNAAARREHPLEWYRQAWCQKQNGQADFRMIEGNDCDCLTASHAVAFEYADRWAEVIGRSLDNARQTGRKPGIVLVMETKDDQKYQVNLRTTVEAFKLNINYWFAGDGAPGADETSLTSGSPPPQKPDEGPGKNLPEKTPPPSAASKSEAPLKTLTQNYLDILAENQAIRTYNIGLAYHKKGDLQRAILEYTSALEQNPRFTKALQNRSAAYHALGDDDKALTDLNLAIDMDPTVAQLFYNRAVILEKKDNLEKAAADYQKASELDPENEEFKSAAKDMKWRVKWRPKPGSGN
ncbi:MAG: tetratricopeptide repeat protein [Deltaproteobacteria bacterium]|nr:tetratricopeptide repeat protein [Deltaproteobacteria bacterium]